LTERFAKTGRHQRSGPRTMALALVSSVVAVLLGAVGSASASVLRVGSFNGVAGDYSSIQAAVDAAHTGDFVLVGPGDYQRDRLVVSCPRRRRRPGSPREMPSPSSPDPAGE